MKRALLTADVHLLQTPCAVNESFVAFLRAQNPSTCCALFVLGDLFDVWLGDDAASPEALRVCNELRALRQRGVALFVMRGNRDFMLGQRFAQRSGATLLPDMWRLRLSEGDWLLMHGDAIVADAAYLRYRRVIRHPLVMAAAGALPLVLRRRIGGKLRAASRGALAKARIDDAAASAALAAHGCQRLVHGHLHRAEQAEWQDAAGARLRRWCLPSWEDAVCAAPAAAMIEGGALVCA